MTTAPRTGDMRTGTTARTDNSNAAVATTGELATTPARGANSFTEDQARGRIESYGFNNVTNLVKDNDGIWRGRAMRGNQQAQVWLDYQGNVGRQ